MSFEPQNFFIGLLDFFSVLLPGALFTYLFLGQVGPQVFEFNKCQELTGTAGWAAFFVASYLFGHLVFLMGASLDTGYDILRGYTLNTQISRLARRNALLPWPVRILVWMVFQREANLAINCAKLIKQHSLDPLLATAAINTFQWCKALLALENPASLATVQRFEADGKFFRSFVIVLILLVILWLSTARWMLAAIGTVLILPALWRYMEQRFKATNQAYWSVITLTARAGKMVLAKPVPNPALPTHGASVVYRIRRNEPEYLLVEARDDPQQWVLPKGRVERKEQLCETAVRTVHEETGIWARISADMGQVSYSINDEPAIKVQFFLMKFAGRGIRLDGSRKHIWLPVRAALANRIHPETRALLVEADGLVRSQPMQVR